MLAIESRVISENFEYTESKNNLQECGKFGRFIFPVCEDEILDSDCIECCTCKMWLHKRCTRLSEEQFLMHIDCNHLECKCHLCIIIDEDVQSNENINHSFMLFDLNHDREGALTPSIEEKIPSSQQTDDQTHHIEEQIHDKDETSLKVRQNEKNTENSTPVLSIHNSAKTKAKTCKKTKKKETSEVDEQLTAHKARIIILEEQNRDYENTITVMQRKLRSTNVNDTPPVQMSEPFNLQNALNDRFQQMETAVSTKIELMKLEMQHMLSIQESK